MREATAIKEGAFFRIPERPSDLERLWRDGEPIDPGGDLPSWLSPEDARRYRRIGLASCANLPAREQQAYFTELGELSAAGLIVDPDPRDPDGHRVYTSAQQDDIWSIGLYVGETPLRLAPPAHIANPVLTREDVSDVPATFVADPFMIRAADTWHMFFEIMNWRTGKGEIGLATSPDGVKWTYQQVVLAEPFHLSYPGVFEWRQAYYMIPEAAQAGAVRLYRGAPFPARWSFVATLLTGPRFVDPSIFRYDEKWWLFAETSAEEKHDTLRLYYADDPMGPWFEHPGSPVVSGNARAARPAGRVLVLDGRPLRYAQNCHPAYGTEVRAFEVTELTTTRYREREVDGNPILAPAGAGWNAAGMHHVDAHPLDGGRWIACVDGWRHPVNA